MPVELIANPINVPPAVFARPCEGDDRGGGEPTAHPRGVRAHGGKTFQIPDPLDAVVYNKQAPSSSFSVFDCDISGVKATQRQVPEYGVRNVLEVYRAWVNLCAASVHVWRVKFDVYFILFVYSLILSRFRDTEIQRSGSIGSDSDLTA